MGWEGIDESFMSEEDALLKGHDGGMRAILLQFELTRSLGNEIPGSMVTAARLCRK